MVDDPSDDLDDADTLAAFTKLLEKIGPAWLKAQQAPSSAPSASGPLESFLTAALAKAETQNQTLTERLDKMRDLLTPEQLILLRSPKPAPNDGEDLRENQTPTTQQNDPAKPSPKPKRKWL